MIVNSSPFWRSLASVSNAHSVGTPLQPSITIYHTKGKEMNIKQEIMHAFQRHKAIQDHAGIVISPRLHRSDLLVVQHKLLQPGTDYDPETFWDDRSGVAENTVELTTTLKICITCLQSIARNTTQATTEKAVFTYETLATLMNVNHRGLHDALNRLKVSGFCGIQPTGWRSSFQVTGGQKPKEVVISDADLAAKLGFGYQVVSAAVDMLHRVGLVEMTYKVELVGAKRVERKHSVRYTKVIDVTGMFDKTPNKKYKLI